jgi:hypothetical protein
MASMSDQNLVQLLRNADPKSIADVIALMESIATEVASNDGLKWFNFLYLAVTKQVQDNPPATGWRDPMWLTRLDVVFAKLYFSAIIEALGGNSVLPRSWVALFEVRQKAGIDRIQFALAGMNAHINHDLSLALLQTNRELNIAPGLNSPEHDDFERVNDVLEGVMPTVLRTLATGLVGEAVQDTGKVGRLLAIWSVRAARDLAWDFAGHLSTLGSISREVALAAQDKVTGALGRALLLSV